MTIETAPPVPGSSDAVAAYAVTQALTLLRSLLTIGGGMAVSAGLITADQETTLVGALVAIAMVGWSIYQKHLADQRAAAQHEAGYVRGLQAATPINQGP